MSKKDNLDYSYNEDPENIIVVLRYGLGSINDIAGSYDFFSLDDEKEQDVEIIGVNQDGKQVKEIIKINGSTPSISKNKYQ